MVWCKKSQKLSQKKTKIGNDLFFLVHSHVRQRLLRGLLFDPQSCGQGTTHAVHFVTGQNTQSALQFDGKNSLNLLQVERARLPKSFWDVQFPTVAAQCGGVKQDVDEVELSSSGLPVNSRAGRTLAAIPKSTIQTSPGFTAGIFVLHAIQHHRSFQRSLVAKRNVGICIGDFQEHFPDGPPVGFGKPWQFLDDFGRAHEGNLADRAGFVQCGDDSPHSGRFRFFTSRRLLHFSL